MPRALGRGDRVAVVSPCGPVLDHRLLDAGIDVLRSWGLDVVEGAHARAATGHLAGTDDQRIADLNAAIADPAVRAIWIARGGYGLTRILDRVDWATLAGDPKLVIGFSDATALLVAAWQRLGLVGVHGHFAGRLARLDERARGRLRLLVLAGGADGDAVAGDALAGAPLVGAPLAGSDTTPVRGPLVGGNLTVLAALAGTAHQVRGAGCVVLLEEVGEAPYRVDRSLTQLRDCGSLDGTLAIVVGRPVACDPPNDRPSATFDEVLADRLGDLGVPVLTGLPVGHTADQRPVLHGGDVTVDAAAATLRFHTRLGGTAPR